MNHFSEQEVLAAFQKLGLATAEDRAKFTRFDFGFSQEERQEFLLFDNATQVNEEKDAKLA